VRVYDNAKYGFLGQVRSLHGPNSIFKFVIKIGLFIETFVICFFSIPLSNFIADVGAESYCSQWFHLYPKPPKNEKKLGTIRLQLRYQVSNTNELKNRSILS